jgi:DNA gyrase/topoisomerase IV subunit B
VRFRPDPQIFGTSRILRWALSKRLEELAFLAPKLTLTWTFVGDAEAAHGLAGRVALAVPCPVADVAKHHGTYETPNGPVDVDVALAWRGGDAAPMIDSFVNLERIPRGTHVSGLLDGVRRARGTAARRGLVAAVSVVLADVKLGEPTRERLITPEVRKCVALATVAALRPAT